MDLTVTERFFLKYPLKSQNGEVHASVCLTTKSVLLLNYSHNNSPVDDVPSLQLLRSKVLSTNRSGLGCFTVQLVDN